MFPTRRIVYLLRYKQQKRYISTTLPILDERSGRPDFFTSFLSREEQDPNEQHSNYSYKTAKQLQRNLLPPVRTKMLVRDFIEDSLYNPNYGFRSKQSLGGHVVVDDRVGDEVLSLLSSQQGGGRNLQQIKYRLTEMVKPWYGHAIAKYMVSEYKLNLYPHRDLIVYEMGGGNKRLMTTILDYIQQHEPHVYKRTRYNLIEPFPNKALRKEQQKHQCIDIIQQDILQWSTPVLDHCFFLGIEAINHFAHDKIRYDPKTKLPYQAVISIDGKGQMQEVYEPMKDSTISRFLATRKKTRPVSIPSRKLYWHKILQILKDQNLSYPEFIPTHFFQFMQTVGTYFPRHRLILSDYHTVPGAIEGINAPLVQAGYKGMLVPCATYQMAPGWFDVLFPTNFEQTRQLYLQVCRSNEKNVKILRYSDFLERYGDIEKDKRIDNLTLKIHDKINILLS